MRSVRCAVRALALSAAVLAPFAAQAATLNLTGSAGAAIAQGTSDTATYTGNAAFGAVTFAANPRGSDLTYSSGAGLGIDCSGWSCGVDATNQIDWPEVLSISFDTPKFLTSIDLSQLYTDRINLGMFSIVIEDAGAIVGDGFSIPFGADDANSNGRLSVAVNRWATSIRFVPVQGYFEDFSVAAISINEFAVPTSGPGVPSSPIPEPSSVLMMTIGGALVLLSIRKFAV